MGTGKKYAFRAKWVSVVYAAVGYIAIAIQKKGAPTLDETGGLIAVSAFIFFTSLPVAVSFWIKNLGAILAIFSQNKVRNPDQEEK